MHATRVNLLLGTLGLVAASCAPPPPRQFVIEASLRPVDTARPMVVFSPIQGQACGRDAVLGALRDMKRLDGVDGYLEVVVEESGTGEKRCARATAYPFRYGTSAALPVLRAGDEGLAPVLVSGRSTDSLVASATPKPLSFDCAAACARWSALIEPAAIKQALAKDRCEQRCQIPDLPFQQCLTSSQTPAEGKACLTPSP